MSPITIPSVIVLSLFAWLGIAVVAFGDAQAACERKASRATCITTLR